MILSEKAAQIQTIARQMLKQTQDALRVWREKPGQIKRLKQQYDGYYWTFRQKVAQMQQRGIKEREWRERQMEAITLRQSAEKIARKYVREHQTKPDETSTQLKQWDIPLLPPK
jgi:hypothetical protein